MMSMSRAGVARVSRTVQRALPSGQTICLSSQLGAVYCGVQFSGEDQLSISDDGLGALLHT